MDSVCVEQGLGGQLPQLPIHLPEVGWRSVPRRWSRINGPRLTIAAVSFTDTATALRMWA